MTDFSPRVLLFSGRLEVRGSSSYTLRLGERLPDRDFEAYVVTPDAHRVGSERRGRIDLREYPRLELPFWGRIVMNALLRDCRSKPPDIVHAQSAAVVRRAAWLAKRLERPMVVTVHSQVTGRLPESWSNLPIRRIIAVSRAVRSNLVGRVRLADDAIEVVPSGVDTHHDVQVLPVLDPEHVPVVGTAGPLEEVKGLPFLLGAAQRVLATGRKVEFLIAGAGPEESNLRRVATSLGIDRHVTFAPNLSDFTTPIAALDVFCLPSLQQGLGTVMLEAMAMGKPVIASGVGGVYSVVKDGETGLVVPPCDSGVLAKRIIDLLDNPDRARSLGEAGRSLVNEQFGVERMIDQTTEVYRAVLETDFPRSLETSTRRAAVSSKR